MVGCSYAPAPEQGAAAMIETFRMANAPKPRAERSEGPPPLPVCQRLRRGGCGVAVLPQDRTASSSDSP